MFWKIDPSLLEVPRPELWACHEPAWEAFRAVATQWRMAVGMNGAVWLGLDYQGVQAGLALAGIAVTPELWAEVQLIEGGARDARNGGRG